MSATDALRANLSAAGIEYGRLGDYTTYVTSRGFSWTLTDNYDGETVSAHVHRLTSGEVVALVNECSEPAHVLSTYDDDGVGHSECGGCGHTIGEWFRFCPWCGAKFTTIERTYRP